MIDHALVHATTRALTRSNTAKETKRERQYIYNKLQYYLLEIS